MHFIITVSNNPVISCNDNIQINHITLMPSSCYQETKFLTRKLQKYNPCQTTFAAFLGLITHQSVDPINSKDLHLQADASTDCTSLQHTSTECTHCACCLLPDYQSAAASKANYSSVTWPKMFSTTQSPMLRCTLHVMNVLRTGPF